MPKMDDLTFGAPCWNDLMTSDLDRAVSFYSELFGWTGEDSGEDYGHYTTFLKDGQRVAAVGPKMPGMESMPDVWTVYFASEDAAATTDAVKQAGGQVFVEPMEIPGMGSMATYADSSGAAFGIWQPASHRGFQVWGEAGAPCWFELLTRDIEGAATFYSSVFGVDVSDTDTGEGGPPYRTLDIDGDPKAGLFGANGIMPDEVPPYWTVYFGVADLDKAIRFIEEQGGNVITQPMDSPYGTWATVSDPMGAVFVILGV